MIDWILANSPDPVLVAMAVMLWRIMRDVRHMGARVAENENQTVQCRIDIAQLKQRMIDAS